MDKHKRYKRPKPNARPASVDGFLGGSAKKDDNPFARHRAYRPSRGRLDDFRRREGFHPVGQTGLGSRSTGSAERQPRRDHEGQIDITAAPTAVKTKARTKKAKSRHGRRIAMKAMTMLLMFGIVSAGYLFGKAFLNAQQTFSGGAAALQENINRDGRINILLLGKGGAGHDGADLTDTIVISSIDPVNHEAALVSIPRDFYVSSGPYGGYTKINAVYANAKTQALIEGSTEDRAEEVGLQAIQETVSEVTGVPIHYYAMVDFKGFEKAVDIVGGVTANVPPELAVYEVMRINGRTYELNVRAGQQSFDGFRALAFSRTRMTSARGDFDRSERQRLMLLALRDKVMSLGTFANPIKVTQLMNTLGNHVRTNLSGLDELAHLYDIGAGITPDKVKSIGLADEPNRLVTTSNIGGLSVVIPTAGLDDYSEIQELLREELRDGFLKSEDAEVAIYNATEVPGLAARTAEDLKDAGYTVGEVDDAAVKGRQTTVIVDTRDGANKHTLEYLEKRFSLEVTDTLPDSSINPGDADFVIILGLNEQNRLQD